MNTFIKTLIIVGLLVIGVITSTYAQLCVKVDCKDSIQLPQTSVTLNSLITSSTSPVTAVKWAFVQGPNTATIDNPAAQNTTARALNNVGTYIFSFTVTTASSTTQVYDTVIQKAAVNVPPVARGKVTPTSIYLGDSAILDGSGSTDSDGTITKYNWSSSGASVGSAVVSIKPMAIGTYVYTLTVTDNSGATNSTNVSLVVTQRPLAIVAVVYAGGKTITVYDNGTVDIK